MQLRPSFACLLILLAAPAVAQIDSSFGAQGRSVVSFDQSGSSLTDDAIGVFQLGSGQYVAVGRIAIDGPTPDVVGIGLTRLLANGSIDTGFDGDGKRVKEAGFTAVLDATIAGGLDILVSGAAGTDSSLIRFNADGADDTTFSGDGLVTFDASGIGQSDRASQVIDLGDGARHWIAGVYDSTPGSGVDDDVYVASVASTAAADVSVVSRVELGGSDAARDRVAGAIPRPAPFVGATDAFAVLADNASPDYAGTYLLHEQSSGSQLLSLRLQAPFPGITHCNPDYDDYHSTALTAITERYHAVIGELRSQNMPRQIYVLVLDSIDGTVDSLTCGPEKEFMEYAVAGVADVTGSGFNDLHLAVTRDTRIGYWRWHRVVTPTGLTYAPDDSFNGGESFGVTFASNASTAPLGLAIGITLRPPSCRW